jgi:hypothetical protein
MNDWPADPRLDESLRRLVDAELAAARIDAADLSNRREARRGRGGRAIATLGALAAIAIVASLTVRGMTGSGAPGASESGDDSGAVPSIGRSTSATDSRPPSPSPTAVLAQSGTFTATGTLATEDILKATVLLDGRVLIVGAGEDSPQLYDPTTGTFTTTGRGAMNMCYATATRLLDGRVLFVGGEDPVTQTTLHTAQVYDPSTGQFSLTGSLITGRMGHTATLLPDGRVLVSGGSSVAVGLGQRQTVPVLASAELYDPRTGEFSATGSMTTGRDNASAALLEDGRVLMAGGGDEVNSPMASAELYDPRTGKFSATGSMSNPRYAFTTTLLPDGRVLVSGGDGMGGPPVFPLETYDPTAGTFGPAGSVDANRAYYTTVLLADGHVLFIGGEDLSDPVWAESIAACVLYDPATSKLTPTGSTLSTVGLAVRLLDGRVLAMGTLEQRSDSNVAQLYEP